MHHIVTDNPYPPPTVSGIYTSFLLLTRFVMCDIKPGHKYVSSHPVKNTNIFLLFSAPSAPVVTVHPGAPPPQPPYQQPPLMQPLFAHFQPYQPLMQPVMPPPAEAAQMVQTEQSEALQEPPVEPEEPTPAAEAQPAAAEGAGQGEQSLLI